MAKAGLGQASQGGEQGRNVMQAAAAGLGRGAGVVPPPPAARASGSGFPGEGPGTATAAAQRLQKETLAKATDRKMKGNSFYSVSQYAEVRRGASGSTEQEGDRVGFGGGSTG